MSYLNPARMEMKRLINLAIDAAAIAALLVTVYGLFRWATFIYFGD